MVNKDQSQPSSSPADPKAGAAEVSDSIAQNSIDVASDGGGTVNDPPPADHKPPSGIADLDYLV